MRFNRFMKSPRLHKPADDGGEGGGGASTGADDAAKAAAEAAAAAAAAEATAAAQSAAAAAAASKAKPTDEEARLLKDVMKQKKAAEDAAAALAAANKQLEAFQGIDPVKARELQAAADEAARKDLEAKGEYERLTKQMAEAHKADTAALTKRAAEAEAAAQALQSQIAEITVGAAFKTSEVVPKTTMTATKARVIFGSHFSFENGTIVAYDKPAGEADRTKLVNAENVALGFDEALTWLVNHDSDKDALWRSQAKPGAASGTNNRPGRTAPPMQEQPKLTAAQKIAEGLRQRALAKK